MSHARSPLLSLTITTQTTRDALVCASVVHPLPFVVDLVVTFSEGGFFRARLTFPPEFPLLPPTMRFITPMWHPNSEWPVTLQIHTSTFTGDSLSRWQSLYFDSGEFPTHPFAHDPDRSASMPRGKISTVTRMRVKGGCPSTLSRPSYVQYLMHMCHSQTYRHDS